MAAEVLRELGIRVGDTLDPAAIEARASDIESRLARERAYRLIAYKERSETEILGRLLDDGYPEGVSECTVRQLAESGLLDDRRFAETSARSLTEIRGLGRVRAERDMARRGIPDELAREALDALVPAEDEPSRALEAARRLGRSGDSVERLATRLVRRGFTASHSLSAARQTVSTDAADTLTGEP
jgi:regulatory protein